MYTKEELRNAVKNSTSYTETLRNLGRCVSGSALRYMKKKIELFDIDCSHFIYKKRKIQNKKLEWQEILVHDESISFRRHGGRLTLALTEYGRDYKCEWCPNTGRWRDQELKLEVDHIDGNWQNNKPNNLRFLCPNCHSQTDNFHRSVEQTYCECGNPKLNKSKKCYSCNCKLPRPHKRKVKRPSKTVLEKEIEEYTWVALGQKYGVSDNAVRKWAKNYDLIPG